MRVDKSAAVTRIVLEEGAEEGAIYNQGEIEQIACYAEDARIYAEKGTIEGLWIYRPAIGTHINIEKEARIDACTVQAAEAIARGYGQLGQVRVVKGTKMPQIETKGTLIRQIQEEFQYAEPTPTVSPTAEE